MFSDMPFRRDGASCELCGARAVLHRVELKSRGGSVLAGNYKRARAIYVCDAHNTETPHAPRAPRTMPAPGTTPEAPQKEQLW